MPRLTRWETLDLDTGTELQEEAPWVPVEMEVRVGGPFVDAGILLG